MKPPSICNRRVRVGMDSFTGGRHIRIDCRRHGVMHHLHHRLDRRRSCRVHHLWKQQWRWPLSLHFLRVAVSHQLLILYIASAGCSTRRCEDKLVVDPRVGPMIIHCSSITFCLCKLIVVQCIQIELLFCVIVLSEANETQDLLTICQNYRPIQFASRSIALRDKAETHIPMNWFLFNFSQW